jgi:hypothetical protein
MIAAATSFGMRWEVSVQARERKCTPMAVTLNLKKTRGVIA